MLRSSLPYSIFPNSCSRHLHQQLTSSFIQCSYTALTYTQADLRIFLAFANTVSGTLPGSQILCMTLIIRCCCRDRRNKQWQAWAKRASAWLQQIGLLFVSCTHIFPYSILSTLLYCNSCALDIIWSKTQTCTDLMLVSDSDLIDGTFFPQEFIMYQDKKKPELNPK